MFKAKPTSVRKLLAGPMRYRLPRFQRHYAWGDKLVTQLFEDIQYKRAEESQSGGARTLILGAIIVIQASVGSGADRLLGRRSMYVIDGQQRMITLTIMLCIIRDMLTGQKRAIIAKAIEGLNAEDVPYRLTLRKLDEGVFVKLCKTPGATLEDPDVDTTSDTTFNMLRNRNLLRKLLTGVHETEGDDVYAFARYVLDYCQLALIEADDLDDAHQIYASLNHSGVALQISSHIKTLAFRGTVEGDPRIEALADEWNVWEHRLGIARFNRLFNIIRAIHRPGKRPVAVENGKIAEEVGGCEAYLTTVVRPAVHGYLRILEAARGEGNDHPEIQKYLTYLSLLKDTDWVGPVIKWFHIVPDNDARTIAFLRRLDRLAYVLLIKGTSLDERARRFKQVLDEITVDGVPADCQALALKKREQERALFRLSNDYQDRDGRSCKLVLMRLCDVYGGTLMREIPGDLTIEHPLPRNVNKNPKWTNLYSSLEEMQLCFKRFANMVLLPKHINERIKNFDFAAKKNGIFFHEPDGEYRATAYEVTNFLAECETWTADVINARDAVLFDTIREIWDLHGRSGSDLDKTDPD